MDSSNIKNPAVWLLNVWDRIPRSEAADKLTGLAGWTKTFGLPEGDFVVLNCLSSLYATADDAFRLVDRLNTTPRRKEQLASWHPAFSEASENLLAGHRWNNIRSRFTAERRVHLDFLASELDVVLPAHKTQEDIRHAANQISEELSELAKDESVEPEFRELIHDLLEALRRALSEYSIRGSKGVFESIGYVLGTLSTYKDLFDSEPKKQWAAKIRESISLAADVATITGGTALMLGSTISGFLT